MTNFQTSTFFSIASTAELTHVSHLNLAEEIQQLIRDFQRTPAEVTFVRVKVPLKKDKLAYTLSYMWVLDCNQFFFFLTGSVTFSKQFTLQIFRVARLFGTSTTLIKFTSV